VIKYRKLRRFRKKMADASGWFIHRLLEKGRSWKTPTSFFKTQNVNISHATPRPTQARSTACFATARSIPWATGAAAISSTAARSG